MRTPHLLVDLLVGGHAHRRGRLGGCPPSPAFANACQKSPLKLPLEEYAAAASLQGDADFISHCVPDAREHIALQSLALRTCLILLDTACLMQRRWRCLRKPWRALRSTCTSCCGRPSAGALDAVLDSADDDAPLPPSSRTSSSRHCFLFSLAPRTPPLLRSTSRRYSAENFAKTRSQRRR